MSNIPFSAASVARFWAEQKIVPEVPMRKLSRTLRGDAGAVAGAPRHASAAAMPMAVLPISNLRSVRSARSTADYNVAAAGHRIVDPVVEVDGRRVDQLERRIRGRSIFAICLVIVVIAVAVVRTDAAEHLR